jgi:hypothetical protein
VATAITPMALYEAIMVSEIDRARVNVAGDRAQA